MLRYLYRSVSTEGKAPFAKPLCNNLVIFVETFPPPKSWPKFGKFQEKLVNLQNYRFVPKYLVPFLTILKFSALPPSQGPGRSQKFRKGVTNIYAQV